MPHITVGIVVFNGYPVISAAIASVFAQTYEKVELVVVDGGSSDGTLAVLNSNAHRIANFVSEPDKGIYDAMNKCCAMARGDWLIFLGSDDVLLNCLHTVAARLTQQDSVYYGNVIIKADGRVYGGHYSKYRLMQENICHQAIFYPRRVYKSFRYDLKYKVLADYEYNLRAVGQRVPYVFIDVNVAIFNDLGASRSGDATFRRDLPRLILRNFGPFWVTLKFLRWGAMLVFRPLSGFISRSAL
jgi:glycosyltransferase involved in cell wall biosynthesis